MSGARLEMVRRSLALVHVRATTKAGVSAELGVGHIWTFRNELVVRVDWYLDQARARAAAGLPA